MSSNSEKNEKKNKQEEKIRIAIVGSGVAGMSAALALAPLVDQGLVERPLDLYQKNQSELRDVGVGVWSTALKPWKTTSRPSHEQLFHDLQDKHGIWLDRVGYKTPNGQWLATSQLSTSFHHDSKQQEKNPGLLFLRECDLLSSLSSAIRYESSQQEKETIRRLDHNVSDVVQDNPLSWSSHLVLEQDKKTTATSKDDKDNVVLSDRDYHLIIVADGMHSNFRKRYGGISFPSSNDNNRTRLTGTSALQQNDFFGQEEDGEKNDELSSTSKEWILENQAQITAMEDRRYTVFRGNTPPLDKQETVQDGISSFQTWGETQSMRFAAVPLKAKQNGKQPFVWFATTCRAETCRETNAQHRQEALLESFSYWKDTLPATLMARTPAQDIVAERAMAHCHCMPPVSNMHDILRHIYGRQPNRKGPGPALLFLGDAFMTIDPILAQGFTLAMEGAHALASTLRTSHKTTAQNDVAPLKVRLRQLRKALLHRHEQRNDRFIPMLRATEIVQGLSQPKSGSFTGFVSKYIVRPAMWMTPSFIKTPLFNAMLKYSLGLSLFGSNKKEQN